MTRDELIAVLEAATGPSMALSREVAKVAGWFRVEPRFRRKGGGWISPQDFIGADEDGRPRLDSLHGTDIYNEPPHYTESVDAALTLVPDGWCPLIGQNVHHRHWSCLVQRVTDSGDIDSLHNNAATPAIALCIAALKAEA